MIILDGKTVAETVKNSLKLRIEAFQSRFGRVPHLAVVLVGEDPASQVYVRNKVKSCESTGIKSSKIVLPVNVSQDELNRTVKNLAQDDGVDGILVQLPLPKNLSEEQILEILPPDKDVDGFTYQALGYLWAGRPFVAPCTPSGVMTILKHFGINPSGMKAVVVGRSNIVGKPMAHLLTSADATVTVCHSKTPNLSDYTKSADIVVVAAGKKHMLGKDDFKKDSIVIDVGIHGSGQGGSVTGDVRFAELDGWVKAATPVPGGVGPMTIATLLENTVTLAEKRLAKK